MHESCTIRLVTSDDLPMLLDWRNHANVRRFMMTQHEISPEEHINWYVTAIQDSKRQLLIAEELHQPIGFVQFNHIDEGGISEWGFYASPYAPKGSGNKLGRTALAHAFSKLKLHKVCGQAISTNNSSLNFHLRLGFAQEGVLRDQRCIDGVYHSVICFGLLIHEWQGLTSLEEQKNVKH